MLALTNIAYFENNNKTLPLGMNISESVLLNNNLMELELKAKQDIKVVTYKNPKDQLSDIEVKTIKVEEYEHAAKFEIKPIPKAICFIGQVSQYVILWGMLFIIVKFILKRREKALDKSPASTIEE
jgi:hypothetical protein